MNLALLMNFLLWSTISMTTFAQQKYLHRAKDMTIAGPDLIKLVLRDGIVISDGGDEYLLYKRVEIIRDGKPPVLIDTDGARVMGDDAETRNIANKRKDGTGHKDWSLGLWSCDGHYIVLSTVSEIADKWDFRNTYTLSAYDTTTGKQIALSGKTIDLENYNFVQWSPTKCGVAILRGNNGNEEAVATQLPDKQ